MIYTYEKFNLKFNNPFKKKKPVPVVSYNDLDPYGEDDWDNELLPPVLEIAKRQGKHYDQVTTLDCSNNQLISLDGIENLVNLQWLYCFNNQLTSLEGIEKLINLKALVCPYNRLTSLEGIENLINLQRLDCSSNQLTSLEGVENLINLQRLDCSSNQLTSLEGIENLVNLRVLHCLNNQFSSDYINYLREHCKKREIWLKI